MTREEPFRENLINQVKDLGQDLIDRAEELVGDGELLSEFDIWLSFAMNGERVPAIRVTKEYLSKNNVKNLRRKRVILRDLHERMLRKVDEIQAVPKTKEAVKVSLHALLEEENK